MLGCTLFFEVIFIDKAITSALFIIKYHKIINVETSTNPCQIRVVPFTGENGASKYEVLMII